jgi:hypothetical protein
MLQEATVKRYLAALNDVVARQHGSLRSLGLEAAPVVLPAMPYHSDFLVTDDGPARDIALTISGVHVVDVSRTSWEQVLEFRENPEDLCKLRRLRLFADEDYAHQSMSYIEDDLARKVFEYRQVVRAAGLPTNPGTFTVNLTSKAIASRRWGTLLTAVFDKSAFGAMAAVKGATIEIGALKLVVSRKRFALRGTMIDNPVSYATALDPKAGTTRSRY